MPELNVWYGPDSYMGANIVKLFQQMTLMTDEEIANIHPKHSLDSIKSLLPRLHYFQVTFRFAVFGNTSVKRKFAYMIVFSGRNVYCTSSFRSRGSGENKVHVL